MNYKQLSKAIEVISLNLFYYYRLSRNRSVFCICIYITELPTNKSSLQDLYLK